MQDLVPTILIPSACFVGVVFALILWQRVSKVQITGGSVFRSGDRAYLLEEEQRGDDEVRLGRPATACPCLQSVPQALHVYANALPALRGPDLASALAGVHAGFPEGAPDLAAALLPPARP